MAGAEGWLPQGACRTAVTHNQHVFGTGYGPIGYVGGVLALVGCPLAVFWPCFGRVSGAIDQSFARQMIDRSSVQTCAWGGGVIPFRSLRVVQTPVSNHV